MKIWSKQELIDRLKEIREMDWIEGGRHGNDGSVGNTVEDILGIEENNLPIPNASEWELKCQRFNKKGVANSLTTLFHIEPSPRACKIVPQVLLPKYGWAHKESGKKYPLGEMSFRQTLRTARTDRGFRVEVNRPENKIEISFDSDSVSARHKDWLDSVRERAGIKELVPKPYWGIEELFHKAGTKMLNSFYMGAFSKKIDDKEYFKYTKILKLTNFSKDKFISALEEGTIFVDFDARTGHNHGTKFRIKAGRIIDLYEDVEEF